MSAKKEENKDAAAAPAGPKKDLSLIIALVFAVLNIAAAGAGLFLVYKATIGYKPPELDEAQAMAQLKADRGIASISEPVMYTMPPFTVNLTGAQHRLIRVEMTFEMLDKDGFEEIVRNSPAARDMIVRILNRKSFDDVETIQGKLDLKDQVAVALNQAMKTGVVKDIYFSQFLVQ